MFKTFFSTMSAGALVACTSMQPVNPTDLNQYTGQTVAISTNADDTQKVDIDRVIDGVLYTEAGGVYNLNEIQSANAVKFDFGRTLLLTAAAVGVGIIIIGVEASDAASDLQY